MERDELIKRCRYYKGEASLPKFDDHTKEALWEYEKFWVEQMMRNEDPNYLGVEYQSFPTENIDPDDKVPYSLKCLLFNRYGKTAMGTREETAKGFAKLLSDYYDV